MHVAALSALFETHEIWWIKVFWISHRIDARGSFVIVTSVRTSGNAEIRTSDNSGDAYGTKIDANDSTNLQSSKDSEAIG